jgi:RNA polymerase sigma-70 factor (ECF subfamily)
MTHRHMPSPATPQAVACALDPEQWVAAHGDALFRYALLRVGRREAAEDLVQETFVAAIRARDSFRNTATVRTWLIGILRRKIVDHYRQLSASRGHAGGVNKPEQADDPWFDARGSWAKALVSWRTPESIAEDRELWLVLEQCLAKLPRSSASAFVLRELEGLACAQLQEELELSAENVRVKLYRARQSLRVCLEKNWFGREEGGSASCRENNA